MALELRISHFSFQYWNNAPSILRDISLTVPAGSVCALLGPTNVGKTTLLQAIAGVLGSHHRGAVASGSIQIGGDSFEPMPRSILFPTVGLTSQDPYFQISGLRETVSEEVALTLETLAHHQRACENSVADTLERLGLTHIADRKPAELSGGELQRVALANTLVAKPEILLLDEPSNSLDGIARQRLASIIRSLRSITTVVIGDFQIELALQSADQFVVLSEGTIAFSGSRMEFIDHLGELRTLLPVEAFDRVFSTLVPQSLRLKVIDTLDTL